MYNDKVLDHFANPRNIGTLEDADGIGESGNPFDGDKITIYIKVRNNSLYDVKFKTFGCGAAIAASSMLTILSIGKTLEDAMKITNDDVAEALGGLPPQKLLCSNIAADALHDAINNYLKGNPKNANKYEQLSENIDNKFIENNQVLKDSNQIQRYLRHIIMPKISGAGQKKIIDTSVFICSESIDSCDILLNYMAASGIGNLYCYIKNKDNINSTLEHLNDLNPDVSIQLLEDKNQLSNIIKKCNFNIINGSASFVTDIGNFLLKLNSSEISPTFITTAYEWQGYVNLFTTKQAIIDYINEISNTSYSSNISKLSLTMSYAFMNTLVVIELIKMRLNIGSMLRDTLYFNLLRMEFSNITSILNHKLENYNNIKDMLDKTKVLIVGTGGLGSPVALALAKAGIDTIGLMDFDKIDISNLNRQILHTTSRIGTLKVESAKKTLNNINPNVNIDIYPTSFCKENAIDIIQNYDIIIDGLDNMPTRYLLNDACYFAGKPLIEAGVLAFYGQVTTIIPGDGPCYRCIFPETAEPRSVPSCSETGVLGPVPGLIGILQATEVIKMIAGIPSTLKGGLLMYDALETEFNLVCFQRKNNCSLCGSHPSITELGEYIFVCKDKQ